ncbi:MAG: hypothetical protein U1A78_32500 [Polyangia bacterium]
MSQKTRRRPSSRSALGPLVALVLTVCTILWIPTLFKTAAAPPGAAIAPAAATVAAAPVPDNRVVLVAVPAKPQATAPQPAQPAQPAAADALLARLNTLLPRLGVQPPARIVAAAAQGDRLVLTFSAGFRKNLADLSALDELVGALSHRVLDEGYKHLSVRVLDAQGRAVPLDELVETPAARRPRPEPIDDGVRR